MKTNSTGKSFTIEKILKIDVQNFGVSGDVSKSISQTFLGSLQDETIVKHVFHEIFERNISQCILVFKKYCYENMQQIYRRTPMLKCHFNKE